MTRQIIEQHCPGFEWNELSSPQVEGSTVISIKSKSTGVSYANHIPSTDEVTILSITREWMKRFVEDREKFYKEMNKIAAR